MQPLVEKYKIWCRADLPVIARLSCIAADRRANGSSPSAWSKGWQPPGAVLHSSHKPGELIMTES